MIRSLIFSSNGLETNSRALDVISNNLANASSAGFKKSIVFSQTLKNAKEKPDQDAMPNELVDFTQGKLIESGNPMSVALVGEGFFTIQKDGELYYTRQGNFSRNEEGYYVTGNGDYVMGQGGPVLLDKEFTIQDDGAIVMDGNIIDYLEVVKFNNPMQLRRVGNGYFKAAENAITERISDQVQVKAGYLEDSNVNTLEEMVNMIEVYRQFEANQKVVRTQDETLEKAVNDVGRT
ncbi:MAG TPA: flagellar hook-basal body protein [bacterium]|nr:flagellar hook-basal body protein [bacterium]HPN43210.1 flagellar hook-basal body protein [bacterium]